MMMHLGASHSKRWLWLSCMAAFLLFACANARTQEFSRSTLSDFSPVKKWEATAPGRIEPVSEEIRLSTLVPGRIARVLVAPNDKVFAGELLIRFDDEEALVRLAEAQAQVTMRQRVRDDESKKGASDRRRAGDAVVEAERSVADAQADRAGETARSLGRSPIEDSAVTAARAALSNAQDELRKRRDALATVEQTSGLPTFPESELEIGRANLNLARIALERTRLRAPIDGQVLQLNARVGEVAAPSQQEPLVIMGDLSLMRIRAELDERASGKVKIGHNVSARATAFGDQTFAGKISRIAPFVGPSRMNAQPSRARINGDVVEVLIDLINPGPLTVGMQVDVYFYPDGVDRSSAK